MNSFLTPDKWTEECPWYQRACIHVNRWLQRNLDRLPWRRAELFETAYRHMFSEWRRWAQHARFLEEDNERLKVKHKELEERFMWLRAQCMSLRVSQAADGRTGWEVMAYIPEEVVKRITEWKEKDPDLFEGFMFNVARPLVRNAINGVVHVNSQGRVNALVFEPLTTSEATRAPKWVMALYAKPDGSFRFSEKAKVIDPGTEEQRARRASGL